MKKKLFTMALLEIIIITILITTKSFATAKNYNWKKGTSWNDKKISIESNYQLLSQANGSITKVASYNTSDGKMDGSTVAGNYLVFSQYNSKKAYTTIKVVDRRNWKIVYTKKDENFGKVNNITFNPNTKKIIVSDNSRGSTQPAEIPINLSKGTLGKSVRKTTGLKSNGSHYTVGGIAYDKENNRYITKQSSSCVSILDNSYKKIKDLKIMVSSLTGQGVGYYNNYIYMPYSELACQSTYQQVYFNTAEVCSALIYVYDLEGNFIKTLYIPGNNLDYGEIESISFDEKGIMYVGVYGTNYNNKNTKKSVINFYKINQYINVDTKKKIDFKPNTYSLSVKSKPTKTTYRVGEKLNLSGGKLTVTYKERIVSWNNYLVRKVTDRKTITTTIDMAAKGVKITGYDKNKTGTQTITVEYDGKKTTFKVIVKSKSLQFKV